MSSLLRFNFRKLKKQKSLYLCVGIMLGMLVLSAAMIKMLIETANSAANETQELLATLMTTNIAFGLSSVDNSSFVMLIGIIIALSVCDDYEQHTIKTIFARGYTRTQTYFSKLAVVFCVTTAAYALTMLSGFALGTALFKSQSVSFGKVAALIGIQYIAALGNAAFMFMFSTLFKRSGLSIAIAIIIPTVMNLILQIIDILLKTEEIKVANFWITSCFTSLATVSVSTQNMLISFAVSIAYTAVFTAAGAAIAKKAEV